MMADNRVSHCFGSPAFKTAYGRRPPWPTIDANGQKKSNRINIRAKRWEKIFELRSSYWLYHEHNAQKPRRLYLRSILMFGRNQEARFPCRFEF
jgi:hypothetical protein